MTIGELYEELKARKARSAFGRGVTEYALEMLEPVMSGDYDGITGDSGCDVLDAGHLLNHVGGDGILACASWGPDTLAKVRSLCDSASYGGNFLIYDDDIVDRLCPPSARGRNRGKAMDLQGRALLVAVKAIHGIVRAQCRGRGL